MSIDIFKSAKPQGGEFFKFANVGDEIQGTYVDVRNGTDSYGNQQTIYVLQDSSGKVWNLGFRTTAVIIHERMNGIRFGQIVGFRFDESRPSKKDPTKMTKIIRVYADPKFVDHQWLEHQKAVEQNYTKPAQPSAQQQADDDFDNWDKTPASDVPFESPATAAPAGGGLPKPEEKPRNDAVDAIRTLAKTKGLTTDAMTEEEADKTIEAYAGFPLTEENLTKIIIKLTGYVSK